MNVERRTWDKEAFEARARSRAAAAAAATANAAAGSNESTAAAAAGHRVAASGDYAENRIGNASNNHSIIKSQLLSTTEDQKEEFLPAQQGRAGPMGSQRAYLKSRSNKVDLESKLGSTEIIDPAAASATRSKTVLEAEDDVIKKGGIGGGGSAITHSSGVSKCSDGVGWHCRVCDCFLKVNTSAIFVSVSSLPTLIILAATEGFINLPRSYQWEETSTIPWVHYES